MDKYVQDGKVAVIYQTEYGFGWYNAHGIQELLFDPFIVTLLLERPKDLAFRIESYLEDKYGSDNYWGDVETLGVGFIPQGEEFQISEYDGLETVFFKSDFIWLTA